MACRGVHFALRADEAARLLAARDDEALVEVLQEEIEERWDAEWLCETDKAWDAIHRCVGDGSLVADGSMLGKCVLGGRQLHRGDDYVISYVTPAEVAAIAVELEFVDRPWLRQRYDGIPSHGYDGPFGDEDFEYTWNNLQDLRLLFRKAAAAGRSMVFTVDR